ncbi:MAG: hypothetical protein JO146_06030, partial [Candidatus Eremiobacteraeota bacterium]|nr:hypothetical protein [Candidatus Eremiobacteraeota bacterium]
EAYSLAIAPAELLGDDMETMPVRIFATDLDADAIAFARRGIYPASALSQMSPVLASKYFTRADDAFQIKKMIRGMTVFGEYDLGQRAPFPRIDLVLCRNVLIYFTKELQKRTLQLFAFSLRRGGYLVLGKSETTNALPEYFATVQQSLKVFRRQGERLLIPAPTLPEGTARERILPRRIPPGTPAVQRRPATMQQPAPRWSLVDRLGAFLFESPIGVVVVDRNYDISTINQVARAMLGIHGQGIGEDLIHIATVPSAELKAALDSAFRNESEGATREIEVASLATSETRVLQVACYPDRTLGTEGKIEGVIVLAFDVTANVSRLRRLEAENARSLQELRTRTAQNAELKEHQNVLAAANDELTAANAELRSTNEHLLISAEEAEAAAEEVETLNEEMQATTEELETLNEELQATVEELNTTNEELAARSNELELIAKEREAELDSAKQTLEMLRGVVDRMPLPTCLLGADRTVAVASNAYLRLAHRNAGTIPALGQRWKSHAKSFKLDDGNGAERTFALEQIELPQNGASVMLILHAR